MYFDETKSSSILLYKGGSFSSLLKREVGRDFIRVFSLRSGPFEGPANDAGKPQASVSAGSLVTK